MYVCMCTQLQGNRWLILDSNCQRAKIESIRKVRLLLQSIYICIYIHTYIHTYPWPCLYDVCMYACMFACIFVCMHVCMYVWLYEFTFIQYQYERFIICANHIHTVSMTEEKAEVAVVVKEKDQSVIESFSQMISEASQKFAGMVLGKFLAQFYRSIEKLVRIHQYIYYMYIHTYIRTHVHTWLIFVLLI